MLLHLHYALNAPDYFTARGAAVIAWFALFQLLLLIDYHGNVFNIKKSTM